MDSILFTGQVAIITGSGQGLGKAYAQLLAQKGATVIINDIAKDEDGVWLADKTAEEIKQAGGRAVPNYDSVADKEGVLNLIHEAIHNYGRIDILIHNAGRLITKPLLEMDDNDWYSILDVHLNGAYHLTRNILPYMMKQKYGRIVMVTSSVGMFGLYGQLSYAAAKMGVVGLMQTLKTETQGFDINCNIVSPFAVTSQTMNAISTELHGEFQPSFVAPVVTYLCSSACNRNGSIFVTGGGYISTIGMYEGKGIYANKDILSTEYIAEKIDEITDLSESKLISSMKQAAKKLFKKVLQVNK